MPARGARPGSVRLAVIVTVVGALVFALEVGSLLGLRAFLDSREQVSDLRLEGAMTTFQQGPNPGLSRPLDASGFAADRNPRTVPAACGSLTSLGTDDALDGRSWTGAGAGGTLAPITLLTVRFVDADAARAELDRKRWAMLRCRSIAVTFPPFDSPATTYTVGDRHWSTSAVGRTVRWTLDGGGRHFSFYVVRYGNTLTWSYDDSRSDADREAVADSLVARFRELARQ